MPGSWENWLTWRHTYRKAWLFLGLEVHTYRKAWLGLEVHTYGKT